MRPQRFKSDRICEFSVSMVEFYDELVHQIVRRPWSLRSMVKEFVLHNVFIYCFSYEAGIRNWKWFQKWSSCRALIQYAAVEKSIIRCLVQVYTFHLNTLVWKIQTVVRVLCWSVQLE